MLPGSQPTTSSDEELARQAQQGRTEAFEELARRYQVPLVRFLHRFGNAHEAEDLTQDTFVRAYENLHRYRDTWKFATWLFTIARRVGLNRNRRRRPAVDSEAVESAESAVALPSEIAGKEDDRRWLWEQAATVLSTSQMTTLWLYYAEEMPVKEVAQVLGRTRVAVKTMLFRARKKLMPLLEEREDLPPGGCRQSPKKKYGCSTAAEVPHG